MSPGATKRVTAPADELRRAIALSTAGERLSYARTDASVSVRGADTGLTLLFDRDPVDVLAEPSEAEVELELEPRDFEGLLAGELVLQCALAAGRATHRGPVWKILRVSAMLGSILREHHGTGNGSVVGDDDPVAVTPGEPEGMWAMEVRRLGKSFGPAVVLDGVDLAVPEGLITVVLGPSGTGKSVLLKHTIGLLEPDRGEVLVRGTRLADLSTEELMRLRRQFGVLFQDGALWGSMTVSENVAFPLEQHTDLNEGEVDAIVEARLGEVGLADSAHLKPAALSGGMRKRAGLARAIALEPEIMLFDEPDSGLDPVRTTLLCGLIESVHAAYGGTFVVVTHDIGVLRNLGHYAAVLWEGRIEAQGFAAEILGSSDPFVRQFLNGEINGPLGMD